MLEIKLKLCCLDVEDNSFTNWMPIWHCSGGTIRKMVDNSYIKTFEERRAQNKEYEGQI